jgi:uncharacterized protein YidB (DUF937 family)
MDAARCPPDLTEAMMAETGRGGLVGNLPTAVKLAAIGLLIHQLMKHRGEGAATAPAPAGQQGGGGLGDVLGGLLGGKPGAAGAGGGILGGLLQGGGLLGGLAGMLGGLRRQGLADEVESWVSTGPNRAVPPDRLAPAFDPRELDEAARQAGTDRGTLLDAVSQVMPEVVDRLTPQGRVETRQADDRGDAGALDSLLAGLGMGGAAPRR